MSRRVQVALAIVALATAVVVHAESPADRACARDGVTRLTPARAELLALFAPARFSQSGDPDSEVIETPTGTYAPMGPVEVIMARIGPDGKPVLSCFNNEAAARAFLDAAPENLPARKKEN
jgi:hypothetical protein